MYHLSGADYDPAGEITQGGRGVEAGRCPVLGEVLLAGALCNDSQLRRNQGG